MLPGYESEGRTHLRPRQEHVELTNVVAPFVGMRAICTEHDA